MGCRISGPSLFGYRHVWLSTPKPLQTSCLRQGVIYWLTWHISSASHNGQFYNHIGHMLPRRRAHITRHHKRWSYVVGLMVFMGSRLWLMIPHINYLMSKIRLEFQFQMWYIVVIDWSTCMCQRWPCLSIVGLASCCLYRSKLMPKNSHTLVIVDN